MVLLFLDDCVAFKTVLLPKDLERDFEPLFDWWIDLLKESTFKDVPIVADSLDFFFIDLGLCFLRSRLLIDLFELSTDLLE